MNLGSIVTSIVDEECHSLLKPGEQKLHISLISLMSSFPNRSSRPEVLCEKGLLRNFAKFTGKHQCQKLFFNKVAGLGPATLLKKSLWHRCFPVNFAKFPRKPFFTSHLWWLLLFQT